MFKLQNEGPSSKKDTLEIHARKELEKEAYYPTSVVTIGSSKLVRDAVEFFLNRNFYGMKPFKG